MKTDYNNALTENGVNLAFLNLIVKMTREKNDPKILDIGCGMGNTGEYLSVFFKAISGTESSKKRSIAAKKKINCVYSGNGLIPAKLGKFDFIYCKEVLPSVRNKAIFFKNIWDNLLPRGKFCTYIPTRDDILNKPLYKFTGRDTDFVLSRYGSISQNLKLLRGAGFQKVGLKRINLGCVSLNRKYISKHWNGLLGNGKPGKLKEEQKGLKAMLSEVERLSDLGVSVHYPFNRTLLIAYK